MDAPKQNSVLIVAVSAAIVGLLIGIVASGVYFKSTTSTTETTDSVKVSDSSAHKSAPMTDTKAANLRVLLNSLEREHVALAATATRDGFSGNPDFKDAAASLDNNSVALSQAIGSVYGDEASKKFLAIWRSHIGFFVNYTVAAKKGDKAGMDKAVTDLNGYIDAISDFFSQANPNLTRDAVHSLVAQHVTLLKGAIDSYGAANYSDSFDKQHQASEQIGTIADAISGAIVKQYPAKF